MRRVSGRLIVGWTVLAAAVTLGFWWLGAEKANLINLMVFVPFGFGVWLVGLIPLVMLLAIEGADEPHPEGPPSDP